MRIGIFGGTFDPVHNGHLGAIKQLSEAIGFDRVHWVLSARPPHKDQISAGVEHRFAMLEIALSGYPDFIADDTEIRRTAKSYTYDTLMQFKDSYPDGQLFLIIGTDSLLQLHSWYRSDELPDLVNILVLNRPGYDLQVPEYLSHRLVDSVDRIKTGDFGKIALFRQSRYDVSSTRLRAALVNPVPENRSFINQALPPEVHNYIRKHQLYTMQNLQPDQIRDHVVDALEDIKGQEIKVIDIADISDFADYMIVVSGTSDTHVKALAREASDQLRKRGVKPLNQDGAELGEWVLVDFGDVVLHVMRPEVRAYYDLEKLWDEDVRNMVKQHREQQDG